MVPYNAILSDMVRDYNRRSAFTGMRLGFSAAAAILCATVPALITGAYPDPKQGYLIMGLTFGVVFAIGWLVVFFGTWENEMKPSPVISLKDWLIVLKNRSFRIYVTVFILCQMAIDTVMTLAVYFLTVSLQKEELFVPIMGSILITQLVFIGIFSQVAQKTWQDYSGLHICRPVDCCQHCHNVPDSCHAGYYCNLDLLAHRGWRCRM